MAENRNPRKPTGETGPVRMFMGPQGATAEFQKFAFPTQKDEIEALIAGDFLRMAESLLPFRVASHSQNKQNDFDFVIETSVGQKYLELAEVALLKSGSYSAAPSSYKPYDFAQEMLQLVLRKSAHYGGHPPQGLNLLLYITHWAFIPSDSAISLLQYWTLKNAHGFEGIYLYGPISPGDGIPFLIYPTPTEQWTAFDPERIRAATVQNLDPHAWKPGSRLNFQCDATTQRKTP